MKKWPSRPGFLRNISVGAGKIGPEKFLARTLEKDDYDKFRTMCRNLVLMDDKLTWFEYAVTVCLNYLLDPDQMTKSIRIICSQSTELKKFILNACITTIGADQIINPDEWNIFRAFAMMLDCPIPLIPPNLT